MAWPLEASRMPTDATTGLLVHTVYATEVINYVRSNLVAVATCRTQFRDDVSKGNLIYFPLLDATAARDVDPHSSFLTTVDAYGFAGTAVYVTIDKWKEAPRMIDDSTKAQSNISDLFGIVCDNAKYELEKAMDTDVNGLYASLTAGTGIVDGATFSDDALIAYMEQLDEAEVPRQDRALVCDPSTIADIYKIDKFMSYDYNQTTFTTDGFRGTINSYKLPVFCTNNLTGYSTGAYGALLQKQAIGLVVQATPKVDIWRQNDQHADAYNVSAWFGSDVLRSTFGIYFYTRKV